MDSMCDIYYGRRPHPWAVEIEEWNVDATQKIKDYEEAQRRSEMAWLWLDQLAQNCKKRHKWVWKKSYLFFMMVGIG